MKTTRFMSRLFAGNSRAISQSYYKTKGQNALLTKLMAVALAVALMSVVMPLNLVSLREVLSGAADTPMLTKEGTYDGVYFPLGDKSFADEVVDFRPGSGTGEIDGSAAIGSPDASKNTGPSVVGNKGDVSLGNGGSITLKFIDNCLIDVEGPDLYVFEYGPKVEPFKVEISKDGSNWINLGTIEGQPTSLDIHNKVAPGDKFSYVRITDANSRMSDHPYAGADIDAVGAIGAEEFVEPLQEAVRFKTYENKQYGFSIEYPEDWQLLTDLEYAAALFVGPTKEGFAINANIALEKLAEPMTAQEYATLSEELLKTVLSSYNKLEEYQTTVSTEPAVVRIFIATYGAYPGITNKIKEVYLIKEKRAYIITCSALPTTYDEANDKYFERMVQSFKFIEEERKGWCFIATVAYGTPTAENLNTLRNFRDAVLLKNSLGRNAVELYYEVSPPLAKFISEHEPLRTFVREAVLDPVVWLLRVTEDIWN